MYVSITRKVALNFPFDCHNTWLSVAGVHRRHFTRSDWMGHLALKSLQYSREYGSLEWSNLERIDSFEIVLREFLMHDVISNRSNTRQQCKLWKRPVLPQNIRVLLIDGVHINNPVYCRGNRPRRRTQREERASIAVYTVKDNMKWELKNFCGFSHWIQQKCTDFR